MSKQTWVFGDCHGNLKALKQIFERAPIQKGDRIVCLGDIADGWHEVAECVDFLLEIAKEHELITIRGNHDDWFIQWLQTGKHPDHWMQGGDGTLKSYTAKLGYSYGRRVDNDAWNIMDSRGLTTAMTPIDIPESHKNFWYEMKPYFKDEQDNIFVHGGFNRHYLLTEQPAYVLWWDRDLWNAALSHESMSKGMLEEKPSFKIKESCREIFIGHTSTEFWNHSTPMHAANIWNLDTGAGWSGKLSIMNIETKEFYQSDNANELYPGMRGRK